MLYLFQIGPDYVLCNIKIQGIVKMGNLNRIQFGIGPSASEKKRTQKTGSISFLNIFFMKWIQILLIIIMKWIQCWKPLVCIVFSVVLYPIIYLYSWSSFLTMWTYLISCVNCSPKIKDCPFCRQFIKGKVKTYMSYPFLVILLWTYFNVCISISNIFWRNQSIIEKA